MSIPKHDEIRMPALSLLSKTKGSLKLKEFEKPLGEYFQLSDEELNQFYDSGNGLIFYDRISWALSYLSMSGLADRPSRGNYVISEKGKEIIKTPDKIDEYILKELEKREPKQQSRKEIGIEEIDSKSTPSENLFKSFEKIRQSKYDEILKMILSKSPIAFEQLVVQLLKEMGYGGEVANSGIVTSPTNDGGIDGIIKEDILGLGRIHIQAKRYDHKNTVGRDEVQKFVGALAVAQSNKGVFITTSKYSNGAIEYANNLNGATNVVLIDGQQLAKYIYEYSLGMQVEQTIQIKKMDSEFWDRFQDK